VNKVKSKVPMWHGYVVAFRGTEGSWRPVDFCANKTEALIVAKQYSEDNERVKTIAIRVKMISY
jgi:hypothetical protein